MNTAIIILAAGASSRMGVPKQLLLVDGKTLIKRVCDTSLDTPCHPIVLVLGANRNLIRKETERMPITVIDNPQWENGMSSSIKMGLAGAYMTEKAIEAMLVQAQARYDAPQAMRCRAQTPAVIWIETTA